MKNNQKLPIADCRLPIKTQRTMLMLFPGTIVNRKSQIVNVRAFTLVELLTVIAVIAVIAALVFPVANTVKRKAFVQNAQSQMARLETALESYKTAYGFYPPSAPNGPLTNQLYYELEGTILTNLNGTPTYMTLDHAATISASAVGSVFGAAVAGFMNCNKPGGDESTQRAQDFLPDVNTNQVQTVTVSGTPVNLLVTPLGGPDANYNPLGAAPPNHVGANPWRYNYPGTNNPGSYDLWIQLDFGGNTNLICNWTKTVQVNNNAIP